MAVSIVPEMAHAVYEYVRGDISRRQYARAPSRPEPFFDLGRAQSNWSGNDNELGCVWETNTLTCRTYIMAFLYDKKCKADAQSGTS